MTRVLLAEDNVTLLEDITLELQLRGYDVMQAVDGRAAIDLLQSTPQLPDIIVSDIAMPDVDGFKLLEYARADPRLTSIPFVFLTAFNSATSVRISRELGADDYIVKPFQADDLVLAIENKIRRAHVYQDQANRSMDDARRTLLHMISHELRTPLSSIYGGAEMLAESLDQVPDESVNAVVDLVRKGAVRLNRFVQKTLALMEIDSGNLRRSVEVASQPYSIDELVNNVVQSLHDEIHLPPRGLHVSLSTTSEPLFVMGIFEYLVMMIEEPLRNAIAFSPKGGVIDIAIMRDHDKAVVTIADQGPGIPEEELHRVWERFVQVNRSYYEQQGTGLGLSVVHGAADAHGGQCSVSNLPAGGLCFTLALPLVTELSMP